MEYRVLGRSDLLISRIGFGTMSIELDNPQTERLINDAIDQGINYFDTADMYQQGRNESLLGRIMKGKRDQIILATKVGNQWRPDGSGWDWNPSKKYILSAVEESLRRLQTDHIDLYQLHGGTLEDPMDEILEAFEQLKTEGKIRFYGISSIRPNVIRRYIKRSSIVSVMMQYSLLDRRPEEEMLPLLFENQVGVLARGTIARGMIVSKPAEAYLNYTKEEVEKIAQSVVESAGSTRTAFQLATQFVLMQPAVSAAVIGIRTKDQLKDALHSFDISGTDARRKIISENILPVNRYTEHR